jgi:hypothetical protein
MARFAAVIADGKLVSNRNPGDIEAFIGESLAQLEGH